MSDEPSDQPRGDGIVVLSAEESALAERLGELEHGDWTRILFRLSAAEKDQIRSAVGTSFRRKPPIDGEMNRESRDNDIRPSSSLVVTCFFASHPFLPWCPVSCHTFASSAPRSFTTSSLDTVNILRTASSKRSKSVSYRARSALAMASCDPPNVNILSCVDDLVPYGITVHACGEEGDCDAIQLAG